MTTTIRKEKRHKVIKQSLKIKYIFLGTTRKIFFLHSYNKQGLALYENYLIIVDQVDRYLFLFSLAKSHIKQRNRVQ